MLTVQIKPHRTHLRATPGTQKLFVLLKLLPQPQASGLRAPVHIVVVIDTSGSMRHKVTMADETRRSKLDLAMEAARRLVNSPTLQPDDRISIIQFDAEARVMAKGAVSEHRVALLEAIDDLGRRSGVTRMGAGLWQAAGELDDEVRVATRVLLLTDGQTLEPQECIGAAHKLAILHVPIISIGLGDTYNEMLLRELSNITLGRPLDLRDPALLPAIFERELSGLVRQTLRNPELLLRGVYDIELVSLTRVYPSIAEIDVRQDKIDLGPIESSDYTTFVLELDAPARAAMPVRLAQLKLRYGRAGTTEVSEWGPHDLVVTYVADETIAATIDEEVQGYVQQRNMDHLVSQAATVARTQPLEAAQLLERARLIAQRFGNGPMTQALERAQDELQRNRTLTPGTLKTVSLGVRTRTVRIAGYGDGGHLPSNEEIRRLTGA